MARAESRRPLSRSTPINMGTPSYPHNRIPRRRSSRWVGIPIERGVNGGSRGQPPSTERRSSCRRPLHRDYGGLLPAARRRTGELAPRAELRWPRRHPAEPRQVPLHLELLVVETRPLCPPRSPSHSAHVLPSRGGLSAPDYGLLRRGCRRPAGHGLWGDLLIQRGAPRIVPPRRGHRRPPRLAPDPVSPRAPR